MQSLRPSKRSEVHFRDDLSEYSSPSNWGERPGPLYFGDHRLVAEGLQARRTVGEAVLRAQWERQRDERAEECATRCSCLRPRTARQMLEVFRSRPSEKIVFTWAEVQSIVLVHYEERGPYLLCVTALRAREDGQREYLLQAGTLRARARWGIDMMAAILRDRSNAPVSGSGCCGSGRERGPVSLSLFMDMARIACEVAHLQPSPDGLERLIEALDLLAEGRKATSSSSGFGCGRRPSSSLEAELASTRELSSVVEAALLPAPHFPLAALRRFGDACRRAANDLAEWRRWREIRLLLRPPYTLDPDFWQNQILVFIFPAEASLWDPKPVYPSAVDHQLVTAAERWRRTLS